MAIKLKRVYEPPADQDGYRVLVDRLWPRGLSEESAHVDLWLRRVAPTTELRKWYALALLDRVLLDRQLSRHEQDELVSVAEMMGLSREDAMALNRLYLAALGRVANEDGVVTSEERADLESVATMLGLTADDVDAAIVASTALSAEVPRVSGFVLKPGDAVVFTGDAPGIDRTDLEYQARSLGLRPTGAVSGKTTLVVAADPDSLSGKACKARDLGVPIVDYDTYLRMLDSVSR